MTKGSGETIKDVYGRDVIDEYKKIREFYQSFRTRESARRDEAAGEVPASDALVMMTRWAEGST